MKLDYIKLKSYYRGTYIPIYKTMKENFSRKLKTIAKMLFTEIINFTQ